MNNQDPTFNHGGIVMIHHRVFREFQVDLNRFINTEVNKHSAKMVGEWCNYVNKQIPEKDALIKQLRTENRKLQAELTTCNSKIKTHREHQNALTNKTQRIAILEKEISDAAVTIKNQKLNIASLKCQRMQQLRAKEKVTADFQQLSLKLAEAKEENDRLTLENSRLSNQSIEMMRDLKLDYEERLSDQGKMKDSYYSAYLSEMKAHDSLKSTCQKQATIHKSQLYDRAKEKEILETELKKAASDLEQVKKEYELSLKEKDSEMKHYLKIINEKDSQESSQTPCCPVCMSDIDENKQWIAFYKCGHQTCSECYDNLPLSAQNTKLCPICNTVISVSVPLAAI